MAGHSKWANIQHRKKAQDARRGRLFTRLIREIVVAARLEGSDPDGNPRLRLAMDKALSANVGKDAIERAIRRGSGDLSGQTCERVHYEGYGAGGVAVLVDCLTDNRNRTVAAVRFAFAKHGGSLGETGSVAYLFKQCGVLRFNHAGGDALLEAALEADIDDVIVAGDDAEVLTAVEKLPNVKETLAQAGWISIGCSVEMRPGSYLTLDDNNSARLIKLLDALEEIDEVQNIYCNAYLSDAVLAG